MKQQIAKLKPEELKSIAVIVDCVSKSYGRLTAVKGVSFRIDA